METFRSFESEIYSVNEDSFADIALRVFRFQAHSNPTYKSYISNLGVDIEQVTTLDQIPFLPITFFKAKEIKSGNWNPEVTFTSSGTTGASVSQHLIPDLEFYLRHSQRCFEFFFGSVKDFHFLALLPSYLEREGSSLITMMEHFIKESESLYSGFYLNDVPKLLNDFKQIRGDDRKTILWGVSFALMDLAENHPMELNAMLFETGGMKGRRKEITREALHETISNSFQVKQVFSEYGMTELLSQAYTQGGLRFSCPPWMKVIGRELTDPLRKGLLNESAGINVIDLANLHSVAFIETEDLGRVYEDGRFEVLGRSDNSDIRGCNLLVE